SRMRPLDRCVNRVAAVGGAVVADGATRLHSGGWDTADHKTMPYDAGPAGKRPPDRTPVAAPFDETNIIVAGFAHPRWARRGCLGGRDDRRQLLVIDPNEFGSVLRLRQALGNDKSDIVADPSHAIYREDRVARLVHR